MENVKGYFLLGSRKSFVFFYINVNFSASVPILMLAAEERVNTNIKLLKTKAKKPQNT